MADSELKSLQEAITKKGVEWQAERTSLSELSAEEQKTVLGLQVDEAELKAMKKAIEAATELRALQAGELGYPTAIDWRNNGGDWTTPVKDQGRCGSCVAFGTAATLEARINIACKNAALDPDLSEAHLFYCGCGACCANGWNFAPALDFCKNTGVAQESSFPYVDSNQACKTGLSPYVKITAWRQVLSAADRKNVLSSRGPMVAGMAVYQDFFSYAGGVYKHVSGNLAGYHAISVVGYNETGKYWICKNSWGTGWGEVGPSGTKGWFRIAYGESGIDTQFAFYDVDLTCPAPADPCIQYKAYLTSVLRSARVNATLRNCLRFHVCGLGRAPVCTRAMMAVVTRVRTIMVRCPQYRSAFCRALMTL